MTITYRDEMTRDLTPAEVDANFRHVLDSANQSYTASGTGATTRTIQSRERDVVHVTDFMSETDITSLRAGSTVAATTAFVNALATGRHVFCPQGNYTSTNLTISTAGQRIFGEGRLTKITNTNAAAANVLSVTANDVQIEDLWLVGNGVDAVTGADGNIIYVNNVTGGAIRGCILDTPAENGKAVLLLDTNEFHVAFNRVQNGVELSKDISIEGNSSRNIVESNHLLSANEFGVQVLEIAAGETAHDNQIINNYIANKTNAASPGTCHAIVLNNETVGGGTIKGCVVHGNVCVDIDGMAVYLNASAATLVVDNVITSNVARNCVTVGTGGTLLDAAFASGSNGNHFSNNIVISGGAASSSSAFRASGADCSFVGNTVRSFTGTAYRSSGARVLIKANSAQIDGNFRGVYSESAADCRVIGNDIYYISGNGQGIEVDGATARVTGNDVTRAGSTAATAYVMAGTDGLCTGNTQLNSTTPVSVTGTGVYLQDNNFTAAAQAIAAAGDAITAVAEVRLIANNTAGSITLTSTPTIADGFNGQRLILTNVGTQDVVIQDQGTLGSSNLRLTGATVTITPRDSVTLVFNTTNGDWVQVVTLCAVL